MAEEEELDWDADDFDADAGFAVHKSSDRWEGEDEDLDEKLKKEEDLKTVPPQTEETKKKSKHERIEERKAQRRVDITDKGNEAKILTAEEEKIQLQKIQKESDLEVAKELFGVTNSTTSIDSMRPHTAEEFDQFLELLKSKFQSLEVSPHYVNFMDKLISSCCAVFGPEDLRKTSNILTHMALEKQRAIKATKSKKKGKATLGSVGKAAKKAELSAFGDYDDDMVADSYDNNDFDFM